MMAWRSSTSTIGSFGGIGGSRSSTASIALRRWASHWTICSSRRSYACCGARVSRTRPAPCATVSRWCRAVRRTAAAAGQRGNRAAPDAGWQQRRNDHHPGEHHRARAARGAAPDFREDGVHRPARRRRGPRGQHPADRHLQLHPDAPGRRRARGSEDAVARKDRAPDVPRGEDRQRPAEPGASGAGGDRSGRRERGDQRRAVTAGASVEGVAHRRSQGARHAGADCARTRLQAAAGVAEPGPECARTPCRRVVG